MISFDIQPCFRDGNRKSIPFWFTFMAEPGLADVQLSFSNDGENNGPTLTIERVDLVPA